MFVQGLSFRSHQFDENNGFQMPDFLQKKLERTLAGMTIDEMGIVSNALHKTQINLRFQDHAISKAFIEVNLLKLKI